MCIYNTLCIYTYGYVCACSIYSSGSPTGGAMGSEADCAGSTPLTPLYLPYTLSVAIDFSIATGLETPCTPPPLPPERSHIKNVQPAPLSNGTTYKWPCYGDERTFLPFFYFFFLQKGSSDSFSLNPNG